jgi:predicted dinucleotide-binding enzyme
LDPRAKVVKAFNTIGALHMTNPRFGDERASMFLCGDDAAAKQIVAGLAAALGFEPVDAGPLTQARLLRIGTINATSGHLRWGSGRPARSGAFPSLPRDA